MTVVPLSLGTFSVGAIAAFISVIQCIGALANPRYRWGVWTAALSLTVALYSFAVFAQFNADTIAKLVTAEKVQMVAIGWLGFFFAGFARTYTGRLNLRILAASGTVAIATTAFHSFVQSSVTTEIVNVNIWLVATPFPEALMSTPGFILMATQALIGFYVAFRMFSYLPRRGPARLVIAFGMGFWMLAAINDLVATIGLSIPLFLLEYGFLVFLITLQALILVEHLRLHRLVVAQRGRIRRGKRDLERMVSLKTQALRITAEELSETLDRYRETAQTLRRSMEEKEVLIKEIHHRTKNNLQVVSSLLNLTLERQVAPELREVVRENQVRIMAMAMVHEQLYTSENVAQVEFGRYLRNLVGTIAAAHRSPECEVDVVYNLKEVHFSIEQAVPLGLWANEVITNAYKHAFANATKGEIWIDVESAADYVELGITDSGPGRLPQTKSGLGTHLIADLPEQVGGTLVQLDPPRFGYLVRIPHHEQTVVYVGPRYDEDTETLDLFDT